MLEKVPFYHCSDPPQAELPQETGGIRIPPNVISRRRTDEARNDTQPTESAIEAYTQYIDVLMSEALASENLGITLAATRWKC